jgi:hypothetical protein
MSALQNISKNLRMQCIKLCAIRDLPPRLMSGEITV